MSPDEFWLPGPASRAYEHNRDAASRRHVHDLAEALWRRFAPLCGDAHFRSDAKQHLHARLWEMYLACLLMDEGFTLHRPPAEGPDILVIDDVGPIWIEATVAEPGSGADRTERIIQQRFGSGGGLFRPDDAGMIVRYIHALQQKADQHGRFVGRGAISASDRYVVAINAGQIDDADLEDELPNIVRSVYPIGEHYIAIPLGGSGPRAAGFHQRPLVQAARGRTVPTDTFVEHWFAQISGLMFSARALWNAPRLPADEIITVHNNGASAALPRGLFQFGREYVPENGVLHLRDHRRHPPPLEEPELDTDTISMIEEIVREAEAEWATAEISTETVDVASDRSQEDDGNAS
jgi:hypothetical protein